MNLNQVEILAGRTLIAVIFKVIVALIYYHKSSIALVWPFDQHHKNKDKAQQLKQKHRKLFKGERINNS